MDQLHMMKVFVAVGDEGSFAGAARRLRTSPPAITRAIAALELELGVRLLLRTTRMVKTTEAGQRYLDDARRILADIDEASETAQGVNREPRGHLTITAPVMLGKLCVMPGVVDYLERFPEMAVSALFLDRLVNLLEEGVDVGVRIGPLPDSSMVATRVGQVRRILCATPAYLAQHGIPASPEALTQHRLIAAASGNEHFDWRFGPTGATVVRVKPKLIVTTNEAAIDAACSGFGIVRLLSYQVGQQLADRSLVQVLGQFDGPSLPVHVVHRSGKQGAAKIRRFIDLMVERLRADPCLR